MKAQSNSIVEQVKNFARNGYAWPGGYPLFALCKDGGYLCKECVKNEFKTILDSTIKHNADDWDVVAVDVNWEDSSMYCDHCSSIIESAYGEVTA